MLFAQKLGKQAGMAAKGAPRPISSDEFRGWMSFMGWRIADVSRATGWSRNTVSAYRQNGADEKVRMACRALAIEARKDDLVSVSLSYPWERAA